MSVLTAIRAKLLGISPELEPIVVMLEEVQAATGLGGSSAAIALKVLGSALVALESEASGTLTHEGLVTELATAHANLALARTAEDAALDARFPPTSTEPAA